MALYVYRVSLPLDIYHNLFNILAEKNEYQTLNSCSLLCRGRQPFSRRSLFFRIDLTECSGLRFPTENCIPVEKFHSLDGRFNCHCRELRANFVRHV
ncbi:hypothetical protein CPB83DRAFT_586700 [Crepidotus variabilis]|uniref:Uncharacterized protein n=1 Tax=Crepidotus variabilis TaxID=179855 RepID=A0A9P6EPA4_9AGAR|nr:hypothetical protein CPB83DRAFT_586700 [Crepidotus variabilis]